MLRRPKHSKNEVVAPKEEEEEEEEDCESGGQYEGHSVLDVMPCICIVRYWCISE
jgi:hypothetical protein